MQLKSRWENLIMEVLQTETKLVINVTKIKLLNKSGDLFVCPNAAFSDIIALILFIYLFSWELVFFSKDKDSLNPLI